MLDQYIKWADQIKQALCETSGLKIDGEYRLIIVNGMGGSGVVGDYLASLTHVYGGLPVIVIKNHIVPKYIDEEMLVFIISYSGNTLETIRFAEEVVKYNRNIVVVSSNGYLEKYADKHSFVKISVPRNYLPRASLPYMLVSILNLLDNSSYTIVPRRDIVETIDFINRELSNIIEISRSIAEYIHNYSKTLLLTTHSPLEPLVTRAKNEFSENSKVLSRIDIVPESMHNDIVGWEKPFSLEYVALTIRDPGDAIGCKLVDFIETMYSEKNIPIYSLKLRGESFFTKLIYGSLVIGLSSIYLAEKRSVDPARTSSIERYKYVVKEIYL